MTVDPGQPQPPRTEEPNSEDGDELILVDPHDREVGHLGKYACHSGAGVLHRAFSVFLLNERNEVLIQQRAPGKRLWPQFWSNSCCSHPRRGETLAAAAQRRLDEELGLEAPLRFLFKFQYHARYDADGSEHELCSVFLGRTRQPVRANRNEVAAWSWIDAEALERQIRSGPLQFTPWCRLEWDRIWHEHRPDVSGEPTGATAILGDTWAFR